MNADRVRKQVLPKIKRDKFYTWQKLQSIMLRITTWFIIGLIASMLPVYRVYAFDVFNTEHSVPASPASPLLDDHFCAFREPGSPLGLQESVERALCRNPKIRQAWADIKVKAAAVGIGKSAYLPTLSGSAQTVHDHADTKVGGYPSLSSNNYSLASTESISLSWVLYDFGDRSAALANAKELLAAALADHEASLQDIFSTVSKDYYTAQAAQGVLETARENEKAALETVTATTKRVDNGVAPLSDELQAQTAYEQAILNRTKAEGDFNSALGTLASDIGLRPDEPIILPSVEEGVKPDEEFQQAVPELIEEALRTHPSVRAAKAQLKAAEAKTAQARAEGLPSIKLIAQSSHNDQPVVPSVGMNALSAITNDTSVGVQVNIPIFEGLSRTYQIRQAKAQSELQSDVLAEAEQKVGLDVWTSYQTLQSATKNLDNSAKLLDIAEKSYKALKQRYVVGVGNIIELLNGQSSLNNAGRQRVEALTNWRMSRMHLAATLGRLGMWSLSSEKKEENRNTPQK
ncbi:MAG: TolC family protein [Terracidiphilus sp.]